MVTLEAFHPYIQAEVPGAPSQLINSALRTALMELCQRTEIWRVRYSGSTAVSGSNSYDLGVALPSQTQVVRVIHARWDGIALEPGDDTQGFATEAGTPAAFGMTGARTLALNPPATTTATLALELAVKPKPTCTAVDNSLLDNWAEEVAHGTLARLLLQKSMPWADPELGSYHRQQFESALARIGRVAKNGGLNASRATRKTSFF